MIWILAMTAIFGPLVVPSVMGVLVWIERGKHNAQTKQQLPNPTDWWRQRSNAMPSTAKVAASHPRHFRASDMFNCPGMLSLAFTVLIAPALWQSLFLADWMLAIHPILCVAWWLTLRRRNVIDAEVYPLAVWILAYVAWAAAWLAPTEWFQYLDTESSGGPGIVTRSLWLLYIALGLACSIGGIALARVPKPPLSPLLCSAAWIPLAGVVWAISVLFGALALVMTVGIAGYGISREMRRLRDETETSGAVVDQSSRKTLRPTGSIRLISGVAGVIIAASVLSIAARESGLLNLAGVIATTWSATMVASLLAAWLARRDSPTHNATVWAASTFVAVTSVNTFQLMLAETLPWWTAPSWILEPSVEGEQSTLFLFTFVQATVVGLIAVALLVVALLRGRAHAYGAMLLGIIWVPIALATAGMHSEYGRFALVDPVGVAGATAMGCILLVIMWRVFGPAETTASTNQFPSVAPTNDHNTPSNRQIADVNVKPIAEFANVQSQ